MKKWSSRFSAEFASRLYDRGRYSERREVGTHHFHELLADFMNRPTRDQRSVATQLSRVTEPAEAREATVAPPPARPNMGLLAVLGVLFGLSVTVGNTIGSGNSPHARAGGAAPSHAVAFHWRLDYRSALRRARRQRAGRAGDDDAGIGWIHGVSP